MALVEVVIVAASVGFVELDMSTILTPPDSSAT